MRQIIDFAREHGLSDTQELSSLEPQMPAAAFNWTWMHIHEANCGRYAAQDSASFNYPIHTENQAEYSQLNCHRTTSPVVSPGLSRKQDEFFAFSLSTQNGTTTSK
jgi:hypothetical protein